MKGCKQRVNCFPGERELGCFLHKGLPKTSEVGFSVSFNPSSRLQSQTLTFTQVTLCDLSNSCAFPAQHRPSRRPSWAVRGEGGHGGRGRLRHLHGRPLRQADRQLLLCRPGHADRPEEVSLYPTSLPLFWSTAQCVIFGLF